MSGWTSLKGKQTGQDGGAFIIPTSVQLLRPEMPLKSRDDFVSRRVRVIAELRQRIDGKITDLGLRPQSNACHGQLRPGKQFAGILLACRRDIAVGQYPRGGNGMARQDAMREFDQGRDLRLGKDAITELVSRIDQ